MDVLLDGFTRFREKIFPQKRELFEFLASNRKQVPHTLFITCCDSRIVPTLITQSNPGDLFMIRNIANLVPPYHRAGEHPGTAAAIEYAVKVLHVQNIIVCGHSQCGGCAALHHHDPGHPELPLTEKWLELARRVPEKATERVRNGDTRDRDLIVEQVNIEEQVGNLLTYPFILEKTMSEDLKICGWYYNIGTGEIFNLDRNTGMFLPVN